MKRLLSVLPIAAIVLTGCEDVSERDCGVFDHPEFALWQSQTGPATRTYMSSDGTTMVFNRAAVELNEPFLGTDSSSNDEDVDCQLSATVRMQMQAPQPLAFVSVYTQIERTLLDAADETLIINHRIERPIGTVLDGNYAAEISAETGRVNIAPTRVSYLDEDQETAEINGRAYEDVIRLYAPGAMPVETDEEDETQAQTDPQVEQQAQVESATNARTSLETPVIIAYDLIKQIVMARGAGIVAFTDAQDRDFVLVNPEN